MTKNSAILAKLLGDLPESFTNDSNIECICFELPADLSGKIMQLISSQQVTLFNTLLMAFNALLYRYTGQKKIDIRCILSEKPQESANQAGIVTRCVDFTNDYSLLDIVRQPETRQNGGQEIARGVSFVQGTASSSMTTLSSCFTLLYEYRNSLLNFSIKYEAALFDKTFIHQFIDCFKILLTGIIRDPHQKISQLPFLSDEMMHQQLVEWNQTTRDYQKKVIQALFEEQVEKTPHNIAVVYEGKQLTYAELNEQANQLAHHIREQYRKLTTFSLKGDTLIGLCVERSEKIIVGMLGILKAGGAYVPLDPAYPEERLKFMLGDTDLRLVVTQSGLVEQLPFLATNKREAICFDTDQETLSQCSRKNPAVINQLSDLAYVIYTSGSTGKPKGVMIEHKGVTNFTYVQAAATDMNVSSHVLQFASMNFDATTLEVYPALLYGASLYIAPETIRRDPQTLWYYISTNQISIALIPPVMLEVMPRRPLPYFKTLIVGGDTCKADTIAYWSQGRKFINAYGPTEITVCSNFSIYKENDLPTQIGKPLSNLQNYVLDDNLRLVPTGVIGELYIGGIGLARGYVNQPEMTAKHFIQNPYSGDSQEKLYKTGDLVYWLPDGELVFVGRKGFNQVKIRGYRIELGEIEAILNTHESVQQCAVVVKEVNGQKTIAAYCVMAVNKELSNEVLRSYVRNKLPDYMVPSFFIELKTLPITDNGKIDIKALQSLDLPVKEEKFIAPETELERKLMEIWLTLLPVKQVGIDTGFLECGGDSLLATQVCSRINKQFRVVLNFTDIFLQNTIRKLAKLIELPNILSHNVSLCSIQQKGNIPLSFFQELIWLGQQTAPELPLYNETLNIEMDEAINVTALEKALFEIVKRHEILRSRIVTINGQPVQKIMLLETFHLSTINLCNLPENERATKAVELATEDAKKCFVLDQEPPVRFILIQLAPTCFKLFITIHHIVADGTAMHIFTEELSVLYRSLIANQSPLLPELRRQYSDFAFWQRTQNDSLDKLEKDKLYWQKQLVNLPILQLSPRQLLPHTTHQGARECFTLSKQLVETLKTLSKREKTTLFMGFLTAFKVLLYRYTGGNDIPVGTVVSCRNLLDIENIMGNFLNTLILRTKFSEVPTFSELLQQVKTVSLDAYSHAKLPFQLLPIDRHNRTSVPQIALVFEPPLETNVTSWKLSQLEVHTNTTKFDLTMELDDRKEGIIGRVEYNTALLDEIFIHQFINCFKTLLAGIVKDPDQKISQLPLLPDEMMRQQLVEWNQTTRDYPKKVIQALFEEQVERTPHNIAVVYEGKQLTYAELNEQANQLAHHIREQYRKLTAFSLKGDTLIGLCVERSEKVIVGMLGILKAGGAYVPLDPAYPEERLKFMLGDTDLRLVVTQSELVEQLPFLATNKREAICFDTDQETLSQCSRENPAVINQLSDLAYVIYTSGSTGKPKGVMIEHKGVVNLACAQATATDTNVSSHVLQFASMNFDATTWEVYPTLLYGASLYIAPETVRKDPQAFWEYLSLNRISLATIPPVMLEMMSRKLLPYLRALIIAGDTCKADIIAYWSQGRKFINAYGPTETTVCSNFSIYKENDLPTQIGKPLSNLQNYVLDDNLRLVPTGVIGELYIGGIGLARGYINQPEMTTKHFIQNPYSGDSQEKLYKTGDLVYWLPDGELVFVGRKGFNQVKIRGYRIELGEIEAILNTHESMQQCAVVVKEVNGQKTIAAYCVMAVNKELSNEALRSYMRNNLPDYMVPSFFIELKSLPITDSGKIDIKALQSLSNVEQEAKRKLTLPETGMEKLLANIWLETLGSEFMSLDLIGQESNFFELGGSSLTVVHLSSRIGEQIHVNVSVNCIYNYPTLKELALVITDIKNKNFRGPSQIDFQKEIALDMNIIPEGILNKETISQPKKLFLTGASGYVGAYLLYELLRQTQSQVYCLLRAESIEVGYERLQAILEKYSIWDKSFAHRIIPVLGDITEPLFGLPQEEFERFAMVLDGIYHCAADVNFSKPYSALKTANVNGTQEALRLAAMKKVKPMHYISTIAVFGCGYYFSGIEKYTEEMRIDYAKEYLHLELGYTQSKWVAEQLVWLAKSRGIPITVFRPGFVLCHSKTGAANQLDYWARLTKGIVEIGVYPELIDQRQEFVTVDYMSKAAVYISLKHESLGQAFHLSPPYRSNNTSLIEYFELVNLCGFDLKRVRYNEWVSTLVDYVKEHPDNPLQPLLPLFTQKIHRDMTSLELYQHTPDICAKQASARLTDSGIAYRPIDRNIIQKYITYLMKVGYMKGPVQQAEYSSCWCCYWRRKTNLVRISPNISEIDHIPQDQEAWTANRQLGKK